MEQLNIYQSANSDNETIKKGFIVRQTEFQIIMEALSRRSGKDPLQHELILGRRGSGKSTLLKRIEIEIEETLSQRYIPINLAEEQASIYRLFDLWLEVVKELKIKVKGYSDFKKEQDYTRYLYQEIHEFCLAQKKQIVLLLDNFDRIVENFADDGNLLRETLINHNDIVIIAASTRMSEHFWRYDQPFYEFFRLHHLEKLTIDEIKELLNLWADIADMPELKNFVIHNPGKLHTVRIITDGLPRTLQLFIRLVVQSDYAGEGVEYLKKIMDSVTPLFQERLNSLTPQLRKMALEMAFIWEACSTKELAEKCMMESKLISANLKTLADKGIVDKIETDKRNLLYRISERFFNMWLIMTQGNPEQKRKAKWLSIFLENWYDPAELKTMAKQHLDDLKNNKLAPQKALVLTKAYSQSKYISVFDRDNMIELTKKMQASNLRNDLVELPAKVSEIAEQIENLLKNKNYKKALELANSIENEEDGVKFFVLGCVYACQGKFKDAEECYLIAVEKGNIPAMHNLGFLYDNQGKFTDAEKYYLMAVKKGDDSAMYNLGVLYDSQNKFGDAKKYYLMAVEKGNDSAMYNLGVLYDNQNKFEDAEECYLMAAEKGNVKAINNLGVLYANQNKFEDAEKYYLMTVEKNDNNSFRNLATLYYIQNINKTEALKYIQQYKGIDDLQIIIELWNGIFKDVEKRTLAVVKEEPDSGWFIRHLLVHQQKVLVMKLFDHPEVGQILQEKYKVLHYACLLLNKKTEDNLILRIPPEIQETINDVIKEITDNEKFYGYGK